MFNNVTKVTSNNFNLVWRMMAYKVIAFLISAGLFLVTVIPLINPVLNDIKSTTPEFGDNILELLGQIMAGGYFLPGFTENYLVPLQESMGAVGNILADHALNMAFAYIVAVLVVLILRFLFNFSDYAAGYSVNENMSSYAKLGFAATVTKTLRPAFKFWLAYTLLTLPFDAVMAAILISMMYYLLPVLHVFTMFLVVFTAVLLIAFRMSLFSFWMPEIINNEGEGVFSAFKKAVSLVFKNFWKHFGGYIILTIAIFALSIFLIAYTFGAGLVLLLPLSTLIIVSYVFVSYYISTRRSYYISYDIIINPPPDFDAEAQNYTIPEEEIQARMAELRKEREEIEKSNH